MGIGRRLKVFYPDRRMSLWKIDLQMPPDDGSRKQILLTLRINSIAWYAQASMAIEKDDMEITVSLNETQ